jgi:hypothetical protein
MKSRHYDIVRKENDKSTIWLEAAWNLNIAESRIEELASFWPGEFQIMDQQNHQIVERIIGPSGRNCDLTSWTKESLQGYDRIDMRKRQIVPTVQSVGPSSQAWLDLDRDVLVEVTSEEKTHPIESALLPDENGNSGWRAADPGTQIVRLTFNEPQRLNRISLIFEDAENTRTQEFVLRWSPGNGDSFREIIRQQWNFSPPDSIREIEDYSVDLFEVAVLELIIEPDKGNHGARASLRSLRLA